MQSLMGGTPKTALHRFYPKSGELLKDLFSPNSYGQLLYKLVHLFQSMFLVN
ncbi:hypothetical protein [Moorena sp. SIO3F7]|uniref:hypothetical protein n=1 Tax=Moorena sp. SIO3F7 TaxID=2607839 RepID=UPI0025E29A55|nr:hypothetical protein [Moorena sp. SIO3F7]